MHTLSMDEMIKNTTMKTQSTNKNVIKRYLLLSLIVSLVMSAFVGIAIFLFGTFNELQGKLLLTTLSIGIFSLTGLANSSLLNKRNYAVCGYISLLISTIGFLMTLNLIWFNFEADTNVWRFAIDSIVLSLATAHISLLYVMNAHHYIARVIRYTTVIAIGVIVSMLIALIHNNDISSEFYYRLLGTIAILDVLGTIITPIVNKATKLTS